ncbi:MAG: ketoacyl-ACP synthase III [Deltaproteobacteria bacterium]|nr:ketoacyl-ACP synthase III [Deltaproteobacteria bacterium]
MLYLHGIGHFHPENVITNRFLEELEIGTDEAWIMERVGIRERRTCLPLDYLRETKNKDPRMAHEVSLYSNAQMAARAAGMALKRAGLTPADIGLVISGSSIPHRTTPAEASTVAAELGIDAPCFDLCSACSTFGMQLDMLNRMAAEKMPPFILTVQPEGITRAVDFSDRSSAVLFGDACSAAVVSHSVKAKVSVVTTNCGSNPAACEKVTIPFGSHFRQDGHAVQGFAIRRTNESLAELKKELPAGRPFRFIGHQANLSVLRTVCERAGIPETQHWHNVTDFGNTGSSGAPAVLSAHWEELEPGDYVAICLVGAGLTWANLILAVEEAT